MSAASSILSRGKRVGSERQRHDGRVGGVDLAVDGRIGQVSGQKAVGGIDGGLHFLLGDVDVFVEVELERDDRAAAGADGGHLLEAGHLAELALEGRGDGRGHDVRSGAGIEGEDLDDGVVHLGQGGDRQLQEPDAARNHDGRHQQRCGDGAQNERAGWTETHCVPRLELNSACAGRGCVAGLAGTWSCRLDRTLGRPLTLL